MEFDAMRDYLLACGDEPEWHYTGLVIDESGMAEMFEGAVRMWGGPSLDDWWNDFEGDSGEDANAE